MGSTVRSLASASEPSPSRQDPSAGEPGRFVDDWRWSWSLPSAFCSSPHLRILVGDSLIMSILAVTGTRIAVRSVLAAGHLRNHARSAFAAKQFDGCGWCPGRQFTRINSVEPAFIFFQRADPTRTRISQQPIRALSRPKRMKWWSREVLLAARDGIATQLNSRCRIQAILPVSAGSTGGFSRLTYRRDASFGSSASRNPSPRKFSA